MQNIFSGKELEIDHTSDLAMSRLFPKNCLRKVFYNQPSKVFMHQLSGYW